MDVGFEFLGDARVDGRLLVPTSGVVKLIDNLDGIINCFVLTPKPRDDDEATLFEGIDSSLPDAEDLRMVFGNFDKVTTNSDGHTLLKEALIELFTLNEDDDPEAESTSYLALAEADRTDIDVWANPEATLMPGAAAEEGKRYWTQLPKAVGGKVQFAVYYEKDGRRRYVNPEPYLSKIPISTTDFWIPPDTMYRKPVIAEIEADTSLDETFASGVTDYTFNTATGAIVPTDPAVTGNLRVFLRLTNTGDDGDTKKPLTPYEISYVLRAAGSADPISHGKAHFNEYPVTDDIDLTTLSVNVGDIAYRTPGAGATVSDAATDVLWMYIPFDSTEVTSPSDTPPIHNAADPNDTTNFINLDALKGDGTRRYPAGDYELEISVADIYRLSSPSTKTLLFEIRPDPSTFTVALNIDSDNDGTVDAADDGTEDVVPGKVVLLNDNDTNEDGTADKDEAAATVGETDLVPIKLSTSASGSDIKWKLVFPTSKLKIWHNNNRTDTPNTAIVHDTLRPLPIPVELFVEGMGVSSASGGDSIQLVLVNTTTSATIHTDTVLCTVAAIRFLANIGGVDNTSIPMNQSLTVSNFVTTDTLPTASVFADTTTDLDNYRLEIEDASATSASVTVSSQIRRGGAAHGGAVAYTLNNKSGTKYRGRYLRLVTDSVDDNEPGGGDAGHQSIDIELLDQIEITYNGPGGVAVGSKKLPVGRPATESDNSANKRLHDVRTINFVYTTFTGNAPPEPWNDTDHDNVKDAPEAHFNIAGAGSTASHDANMSTAQLTTYTNSLTTNFSDRLAQAGVVGASGTNFGIAVPGGVTLGNGVDFFNKVNFPAATFDLDPELISLLAGAGVRSASNSDASATNDVVDVIFLGSVLRTGMVAGQVALAGTLPDALAAGIPTAVGTFHGSMIFGLENAFAGVSHYSLAHETCHLVLNLFDTAANMPSAANRPGSATERDMIFPERHGNPITNAVSDHGKRMTFSHGAHVGQVQTFRSNSNFVRD